MLNFNDETKRLVSTFFNYRNDIDIYTEDENKDKEFYKFILKKILRSEIKINDVTPLGCRDNVIRRCIEEPINNRKKLFIVDCDINIIHGLNIPSLPNLFVLDAYCIENLLFDQEAVTNFIYHNCAVKSIEKIEQELCFEDWLNSYSAPFIDLFLNFAVADILGENYQLYNANRFHRIATKGILSFDSSAVYKEIDKLKQEILANHSQDDYEFNLRELKNQWEDSARNLLKIVSGKDYLIPLLLIKTQAFKKSKSLPSLEEVKLSLANFSDLKRFKSLKSTIEALFEKAA